MTEQPEAEAQCTDAVMLIRPAAFSANPETAASNAFQQEGSGEELVTIARGEFDGLLRALTDAGVRVIAFDDQSEPPRPDACFPNNWVSFHADGTVVLYPMLAPSRRRERRPELIIALQARGCKVSRTVDLSAWEERGEFLEGTGSLLLDRPARVAYACRSPRSCAGPLADFSVQLGYRVVEFSARGAADEPAYHTNVLLTLGRRFAVLCAEAVDADDRERVLGELHASGRDLLLISREQMGQFAGNMLALDSAAGDPLIALSAAALACLDARQLRRLEGHGQLWAVDIPTIERHGGGSVRCMIAEIFLPH